MKIAQRINRLAGRFGLALIRKPTLDRLLAAAPAAATPAPLLPQSPPPSLERTDPATDLDLRQLLRHQIEMKWSIVDEIESDRPALAHLTCPLCDHAGEAPTFGALLANCMFGGGSLLRHQCPQCDLIFGPAKMLRLSETGLARDYEWHYRVFTEGDSTAQEVRAFHALQPRPDGIYLNWGAGAWSQTVDLLRQEGWQVYGYEPHGSATGGSPHCITDQQQLAAMRFDGIFSNNVLEHLRHPARDLAAMRALLRQGGRMSHATPCFEYLYEFTRFHLFFYPGRARATLAARAGLQIDATITDGEFINLVFSAGAA